MPEGGTERRERDAGVAAARLDDRVARLQHVAGVGFGQDVARHAILDRAGHVHRLVLGVEPALATVAAVEHLEQRCVADHLADRGGAARGGRRRGVDRHAHSGPLPHHRARLALSVAASPPGG
jgi:hypothetical protein